MASLQEQLAKLTATEDKREDELTTTGRLQRILAKILREDVEAIDPNATLSQLGASSLDIIELAVRTEVEFRRAVDASMFPGSPADATLAQLAAILDER